MHPLGREFFLSQFLEARHPGQFKLPWRLLLAMDPMELARQLLAEGLLEQQGSVWSCTAQGQVVAQDFLRQQGEGLARARQDVLSAFVHEDYEGAARSYLAFESQQPFPSDKALNPTQSSLHSLIEDLQAIAVARPALLGPSGVDEVRPVVALAWLWGPADSSDTAVAIMLSHVANLRDLQRYAQQGVTRLQMLAAEPDTSCPQCLSLHERFFAIGDAPELPNPHCSHNPPCRCFSMPDFG